MACCKILKIYLFIISLINIQFVYGQNTDTLLKRARITFEKDPDKGILLAKQAYHVALKQSLVTPRLKSLNLLSIFSWEARDNLNAAKYASEGLNLARRYGPDSLTGNFLITYGLICYTNNNYDQAIKNYQEAIPYFAAYRLEKKIAIAYLNIGICQRKLSKFEFANASYFNSAAIFEKLKDSDNLCGIYNSIGNCFSSLKNYRNAVKYHRKALILSTGLNNKQTIAQSLNNIGYAYKQLNDADSAIYYLNKCLVLRKTEKDSGLLVLTLQNLGSAWKQKGDMDKALPYLKHAVKLAELFGMKDELARGYLDLGDFYQIKKDYKAATEAINTSERLALTIKSPELLEQIFELKSNLSVQLGKFAEALHYEKMKNVLRDSLFNIEKTRSISEIEIKYQTSQKDKDINTLHLQSRLERQIVTQQKIYIVVLIISLIIILALLFFGYKSYVQKKKDNQHIQHLMKELHHRVKNNLQILSGLFTLQLAESSDEHQKNSIRENELRLNSMNLVHQKLYNNDNNTSIDMHEYLEQLTRHIQISFGHKSTNIKLIVDAESIYIAADKAVNIGLIVNELVTNAYKYAFSKLEGTVNISFIGLDGNVFLLTVKDNGDGIKAKNDAGDLNSFGLKLVNIMVRQLKASMVVEYNNGVSYKLTIPNPGAG